MAEPAQRLQPAAQPDKHGGRHRALDFLAPHVGYDETAHLVDGIRARFLGAGHLLGSAVTQLELDERTSERNMPFSGDLGNPERPILRDPTPVPAADYMAMESTQARLEPPTSTGSRGKASPHTDRKDGSA